VDVREGPLEVPYRRYSSAGSQPLGAQGKSCIDRQSGLRPCAPRSLGFACAAQTAECAHVPKSTQPLCCGAPENTPTLRLATRLGESAGPAPASPRLDTRVQQDVRRV
jgi:hypothetical protein